MKPDERAAEIVLQFRERSACGEDVAFEDILRAHPDLAATLRRQFDALRRFERAYPRSAPGAGTAPLVTVGCDVGPYSLVRELGSGGMGTVFLAERGDARVAVKVLHPHLVARPGHLERFLREADIGRRVRHPNVVATLDAGAIEIGGRAVHYLVMEHVEGRTLRALAADLSRLPEELCRHVGREVARGLAAIHEAGAVHRDLKPDNVIVTQDHVVKVMDFGVARIADESMPLSQTGAFVGSIQYGAPEQLTDAASVDARADLHALGLLLYEMATGTNPFAGDDVREVMRKLLDARPRRCAELNPQLSPLFEELLAQLLEKDRSLRPSSAEDVARILDEGEESGWWRERARAIREETKRPLRRIRIPRETALYGRDAELARLAALFEKAKAGDGQVVLVEGEAGIGKSRLVDECVSLLHQQGHDVNFLYGSYPPGGAATASGAFSSAYREHLGDDESAVRAALPQTPLLAAAFAALLRGDIAPESAEKLTKDSLQTVFVHATRSFASQRPTIVLIDDLHFAPEEGRALFASLALAVPGHRVLLVGCARPSLDEKWLAQIERLGHATRLPLPRLGAKDLVLLLRDTLKSEHLAEELAAKIAVKSDGNPFFVFEILRGLREGQFITKRSDGTWATTREIRDIQVPSSVVELVQARVSDLGADDRNVLEVASCVGFEFDPSLVGDVLRMERIPLLQRLGRIEKTHRLVRSVGRRFVFDHHQVMEVLYAGLSEPLREEYHAAIGTAMEARSGAASKEPKELDGALCVDLADHLLKGAQGPRALRYLDAALAHLETSHHNGAVNRLIDQALECPCLVEGRDRARLLLRRANRLDILGRRDAGCSSIEEALAHATGDVALLGVLHRTLGWLHFGLSRNDEAIGHLGVARELAAQAGDILTEGLAIGTTGLALQAIGRLPEAAEHFDRHLALARRSGNRFGEAGALTNLGSVLLEQGRVSEATDHQRMAMSIAQAYCDRRTVAACTGNLGGCLHEQGLLDAALEHDERCLRLAVEVGDRAMEARGRGNLGEGLLGVGRLAEAMSHFERYLAMAQEIGDRRAEGRATGCLGAVLGMLGRSAEAGDRARRSLLIRREIRDETGEASVLCDLAEFLSERADPTVAVEHVRRSLTSRRSCGDRLGEVESRLRLGSLLADLDRRSEARAELVTCLTLAREAASRSIELRAASRLASLGELDASVPASLIADSTGRFGVPVALVARFDLWRATHDRAHLAESKRLLDHLVAHAPLDCRESMLTNVPLHRDIAAAARQMGLPLAADWP